MPADVDQTKCPALLIIADIDQKLSPRRNRLSAAIARRDFAPIFATYDPARMAAGGESSYRTSVR
jgi:hypothetical protein